MNTEPKVFWQEFLGRVRGKISDHVFRTWFETLRCTSVSTQEIVLEVDDTFRRDWIEDHYRDFVEEELCGVAGHPVAMQLRVSPLALASAPVREPPPSHAPANERVLLKKYVFDTYVQGASNQFAFAACRRVAENPATTYNPLFLYGGAGLGKTHLLNAIGHELLGRASFYRIRYTSAEEFMNELIQAIRYEKMEEFRAKYRNACDILLLDDIHIIAGKERTQEEFFHTFNALHTAGRQIVVTSDKPPHEIPGLEERLRSRFQWGLIADIQPPELETRIAILRHKMESEQVHMPDDVVLFLAQNIKSNIRELEGAFIRVAAHASITRMPMTVPTVKQVLHSVLNGRMVSKLSMDAIQKIVAEYYNVKVTDIKGRKRTKVFTRPRQVAMYLCRKHLDTSYPELGRGFGGKDHTTVLSAVKKIDDLLHKEATLRTEIEAIERELK